MIFFLLGALTIVEIISVHKGFNLISNSIKIRNKRKLLWFIGFLTFFLSAVLDNLTTTILMVTLLRRLIPEGEDRLLLGGAVVIAANAGGAWTPIGDVTTTMLWIGEQVSTMKNHAVPLSTKYRMSFSFAFMLECLLKRGIFFGVGKSGERQR